MNTAAKPQRKIIHVDMDCFFAAIEIRDNPSLATKPVAVGGSREKRGVLCTCNYIARQFGVSSAMPTAYAKRLCPELIILPVSMDKYQEAAQHIRTIFQQYTELVEPLSLDEAYLDVTNVAYCQGSATLMAKDICKKINKELRLPVSAGVAPNKFLAKIASGWKKPNGLFVIPPEAIDDFVKVLPVKKIFGVGKVTAEKLHQLGVQTCSDLQSFPLIELIQLFGKFGQQLYEQSRGIDNRVVNPNRTRKSLSVEHTFETDLTIESAVDSHLDELYHTLVERIQDSAPERQIKNQYIKIKFADFRQMTREKMTTIPNVFEFKRMLLQVTRVEHDPIRLLGLGVHFQDKTPLTVQKALL